MTIPIIPGPFSFLKDASDAGIEAFYRAQARKDAMEQLQRQRDLQNVGLFTQLLPYMQPNVAAPPVSLPGVPIAGMTSPAVTVPSGPPTYEVPGGVGESLNRLGFGRPRLGKSAQMRQQEAEAKVAERTVEPTVKATEARASLLTTEAETQSAEARKWLPILQGLTPQQIMQQKGIMSPEVADLADKVAFEKLKTEQVAQDPTRKELQVQGMVRDALIANLPKDPAMMKIAEYASIGGLGYLIAGLQQSGDNNRMTLALNRDRINLMNQITVTTRQLLTQAEREWEDGLHAATNTIPIQTAPEKKRAKLMLDAQQEYINSHPKPDPNLIFKSVQKQYGMTPEEFQKTARILLNLTGEPTAKSTKPATPVTKRKVTQDQADFLKSKGRWDESKYEIIK